MAIHATQRCERCAFATPVSDKKCFCIFHQCPYEKSPDPFNENQRRASPAAKQEEKREEKSRKRKVVRASAPQAEIPTEKAEDDTQAQTAL